MKHLRVYVCAFLFVALSSVKLVAPALAADIRSAVQMQISRTDDYSRAEQEIESVWIGLQGKERPALSGVYDATLPMEQLEQSRVSHTRAYLSALPEGLLHPETEPGLEAELSRQASRDAALAERDRFLKAQSAFSDRALPANVSYDLPELPFSTAHPVQGRTSSGFGFRMHPIQQSVKFHYGTDVAADTGMEIAAFADGTVLAAGQDAGYGNYVKIDHGDGFVTLYGHCSEVLVSAGESVTAGQTIARVGATGLATGPHLHFELIHEGVYLNPEFYLAV